MHINFMCRGGGVFMKKCLSYGSFFLNLSTNAATRHNTPDVVRMAIFWKRNTTEYNNKSGGYSHNKTIFKNCFNKICPMQVNKLK